MIRYAIAPDELRRRITAIKATWFDKAREAIAELPDRPAEHDFRNIWREIKPIYTELQASKCAFCEKPLEGAIEQDVEHFRPKSGVTPWEPPADLLQAGLVLNQPHTRVRELGYRFLA